MGDAKWGKAYIFNHLNLHSCLKLDKRTGTNAGRDNLLDTLEKLDFEVNVYEDLNRNDIDDIPKRHLKKTIQKKTASWYV